MSNQTTSSKKATIQFQGIELLQHSINTNPGNQFAADSKSFHFKLDSEIKGNPDEKLLFIIVSVSIENEKKAILGTITVSNIFYLENFEGITTVSNDKFQVENHTLNTLNMIAISTTRGVMFSTFKNTFLQNAILPLIDPAGQKSEF